MTRLEAATRALAHLERAGLLPRRSTERFARERPVPVDRLARARDDDVPHATRDAQPTSDGQAKRFGRLGRQALVAVLGQVVVQVGQGDGQSLKRPKASASACGVTSLRRAIGPE